VSNLCGRRLTSQTRNFRKVLPIFQSALALFFGGWGLWLRNSILNQRFFDSTLWDSTARFHVWPWPFRFAAVLNTPALLFGLLLSVPIDAFRPGLSEWALLLPSLLLVPLLWYLIAVWIERRGTYTAETQRSARRRWILICLFTTISLVGAATSGCYFGSYTAFLPFGIALWTAVGIGMLVFGYSGKRMRRRKLGEIAPRSPV
jgi:hypothetical protein